RDAPDRIGQVRSTQLTTADGSGALRKHLKGAVVCRANQHNIACITDRIGQLCVSCGWYSIGAVAVVEHDVEKNHLGMQAPQGIYHPLADRVLPWKRAKPRLRGRGRVQCDERDLRARCGNREKLVL